MADKSISVDILAADRATAALGQVGAALEELALKIRETSGKVNIGVDVDSAKADAQLEETKRLADETGRKSPNVSVSANNGPAIGQMAALGAAIAALSPLALAAIGAIAGIGAAAGGGLGVGMLAFSGLGEAVSGMGKQAAAAGGAMSSNAGAIRAATSSVVSAQENLTQANKDERTAQLDLVQARKDAAQQLVDLRRKTEDMALSQADAALSVQEAQQRVSDLGNAPGTTSLQMVRAQLSLQQAIQRQKEMGEQAKQLATDKASADAKGVAGSDLVAAAQDRIAQAQQKVVDATRRLADAQASLADASKRAGAGGAAGMNALNAAMANLSPTGQVFAKFLRGFLDGPLKELRFAAQDGLFPPLMKGLKDLEPVMKSLEGPVQAFAKVLGEKLGGGLETVGRLAGPFLDFATESLKGLHMPEGFITALSDMFTNLAKSGTAQKAMFDFSEAVGTLAMALPDLITQGQELITAWTKDDGKGGTPVKDFAQGVSDLGTAIKDNGPWLKDLIGSVGSIVTGVSGAWHQFVTLKEKLGPVGTLFSRLVNPIDLVTGSVADFIHSAKDAKGWWDGFVKTISTTASRLRASGMFDGIKQAFRSAINFIIGGWNGLHFAIPGVSYMGVTVGGADVRVPQIPYLAKGGIVTRPTLAMVGEAGPEAVIPLSGRSGASLGSVYHVTVHAGAVGSEDFLARKVTQALQLANRRGYGYA